MRALREPSHTDSGAWPIGSSRGTPCRFPDTMRADEARVATTILPVHAHSRIGTGSAIPDAPPRLPKSALPIPVARDAQAASSIPDAFLFSIGHPWSGQGGPVRKRSPRVGSPSGPLRRVRTLDVPDRKGGRSPRAQAPPHACNHHPSDKRTTNARYPHDS